MNLIRISRLLNDFSATVNSEFRTDDKLLAKTANLCVISILGLAK